MVPVRNNGTIVPGMQEQEGVTLGWCHLLNLQNSNMLFFSPSINRVQFLLYNRLISVQVGPHPFVVIHNLKKSQKSTIPNLGRNLP